MNVNATNERSVILDIIGDGPTYRTIPTTAERVASLLETDEDARGAIPDQAMIALRRDYVRAEITGVEAGPRGVPGRSTDTYYVTAKLTLKNGRAKRVRVPIYDVDSYHNYDVRFACGKPVVMNS